MAGESDGSRAVLVSHQHTRARTSSLLGTDGLPPSISFSTNYLEPPKKGKREMDSSQDDKRIQVTREYFRLADQGRREVLDLFHDEAEIYFPKFGTGFGRQSLFEMVKGFDGVLEFIQHDYDKLTFIPAGDYVVVEGTSRGRLSGKTWAGGETPGGRFCNVFKFRGDRISSLHVYLDPDYTGEDIPRFRWGVDRKW